MSLLEFLPRKPRVLALGEPTHDSEAILDARNHLFRPLVEQHGYRAIALESDCMKGLLVDDYIAGGNSPLVDVMAHGFSHDWGRHAGNLTLVRWMREFNEGRPAHDRVRFAGFDAPMEMTAAASPRHALLALHAHLAEILDVLPCTAEELDRLLGSDEQWTNPDAMMDPTQSIGRSDDARRLGLLADDLHALLDQHVLPPDRQVLAQLHARTAVGLLRYHHHMADASSPRKNRFQLLCADRDSMMAANLKASAAQSPTLVYAHNAHLQLHRSSMPTWDGPIEWWSAGALVSAELREQYAFVPTALGTMRSHDVTAPEPDTVEGHLYDNHEQWQIVSTRTLPTDAAPRISPWYGYAPLDPDHVTDTAALLFVRDV